MPVALLCGCTKVGKFTNRDCGRVGEWRHPRYPNGLFCNKHKELVEHFFPNDWSRINAESKEADS